MFKHFYILVFILCTNICWSNDSISEERINLLSKRIEKLEERLDVEKKNKEEINRSDIVQEYKDLNNLYSIGFGILIGLFGFIFPMILYLIQIRPAIDTTKESKALLKKIDDDFEKSFEKHLRKSKNKLIDQAIDNFENLEEHRLPTSYNLLDTYKSEGFTPLQVVRIIKLLKNRDIDSDTKIFLSSILGFQEDSNIEYHFVDLIENYPEDKTCIYGALYFANHNKVDHMDLIANIVIHGYSVVGMISSLSSISKKFTIEFMNNHTLVEGLNHRELFNVCQYLDTNSIKTITRTVAESTDLWRKYLNLNTEV